MCPIQIFRVGGCVRDQFLGRASKDIDFSVVLGEHADILRPSQDTGFSMSASEGFSTMREWLLSEGLEIFEETPSKFTIRGKLPKEHRLSKWGNVVDFVLARREHGYTPGTRSPIVSVGSLYDDLARRDFTVNAMALDMEDNLIDLFNGQQDIERRLLVTPLDPRVTMMDDPLRFLRALRFSVTLGFTYHRSILQVVDASFLDKFKQVISPERISAELTKMMKHDVVLSLELLSEVEHHVRVMHRDYPSDNSLHHASFYKTILGSNKLWLMPTNRM